MRERGLEVLDGFKRLRAARSLQWPELGPCTVHVLQFSDPERLVDAIAAGQQHDAALVNARQRGESRLPGVTPQM